MRKILLLLSSVVSLSLSASLKSDFVAVINGPKGFAVLKDGKIDNVGPEAVDSTLRKMDFQQRNMFLLKNGNISVDQDESGQFHLKFAPKLNGGGVWGARIGAFLGKAIVSIVGHGVIAIITKVASRRGDAAAVATGVGLESTMGAAIEAASMKGAIIGGIIGGIITGPL